MSAHYYSSTSVATALSAAITSTSATTFTCPDVAGDNGWPTSFPFTLAIDYGTVGVELVDVTSKGTATGGIRTWNITRGVDFTTASTHLSGAKVQHVICARDVRSAQAVQPDPASTSTQITQETTAGSLLADSAVGDFIFTVNSANAMLFGLAGGGSYLRIDSTNKIFANYELVAGAGAAAFRRGNANPFGTNYIVMHRASLTQSLTANTWTDIAWNFTDFTEADDGTITTSSRLVSQVAGIYIAAATVSWNSLTGTNYLRLFTQGGSQTCQNDTSVAIQSLSNVMYMPGGGYYITVQGNVTSAKAVSIHSSTTPSQVTFGQVL